MSWDVIQDWNPVPEHLRDHTMTDLILQPGTLVLWNPETRQVAITRDDGDDGHTRYAWLWGEFHRKPEPLALYRSQAYLDHCDPGCLDVAVARARASLKRKITVVDHVGHAEQADCPWLNLVAANTCHRGCYDEPSCITDGPFRPTGRLWDREFISAGYAARWQM